MGKDKKPKVDSGVKTFYVIAGIVVLALIYMFVWLSTPKDVAKVNKNTVNGYEFSYYLTQYVQQALKDKSPYTSTQSYLYEDTGYGSLMDSLKQYALTEAVRTEILLIKAKEDNFKVGSKVLKEEWKNFRSSLEEEARARGISLGDYVKNFYGVSLRRAEKIYKDNIKTQKYMEAKTEEIEADEQALIEYYEKYKNSFDKATVRHILALVEEGANTDTVAQKEKLAQDLLGRVNSGEDFAALAKEYSEDPGSKDNGGMYTIQYGQMVPEFEDWTFSHKAGDTGIVKTIHGFHVMKLDSVYNTLDSQRDDIEKSYKMTEYQKKLDEAMYGDEFTIEFLSGFDSAY